MESPEPGSTATVRIGMSSTSHLYAVFREWQHLSHKGGETLQCRRRTEPAETANAHRMGGSRIVNRHYRRLILKPERISGCLRNATVGGIGIRVSYPQRAVVLGKQVDYAPAECAA